MFTDTFFPEERVILEAKGVDNNPLWQKHDEWMDGTAYSLPGDTMCATYLYRTITAPNDGVLTAGVGNLIGVVRKLRLGNTQTGGVIQDEEDYWDSRGEG